MTLTIRKATIDHVAHVAPRLRDADRREIMAFVGVDPGKALWASYYHSDHAWAVLLDGEPVGIFGCGDCCPWLLGTDRLKDAVRLGIRQAGRYIGIMLRKHGILWNYVHAENREAIRWLKWLGFEMCEPEPIGIDGAHFHQFIMLSTSDKERACASKQQVS